MGAPPPFIIDFWLWLWLLFCFMLLYVYTSEYLIWLDQYESHPVHSSAENLLAAGHPLPPLRPPPLITPRSSPLALHKISKSHTPTSDCWPGTGCWGSWPAAILEILLSSTSIKQKKKKKNSLVSAGLKIWQIYFILAHNRDVGHQDLSLKEIDYWKNYENLTVKAVCLSCLFFCNYISGIVPFVFGDMWSGKLECSDWAAAVQLSVDPV